MEPFELDAGNTAWMLAAASLVLLMTPALAFFYGGMTRSKTVLNMMMMSFGALAVVGPDLDALGLLGDLRRRTSAASSAIRSSTSLSRASPTTRA